VHIDWNRSPEHTLGVEVELELVDATTGELVAAATDILAELGVGHPGGVHPKAKHELFECTIEIITGICGTVAEARADLEGTLAEVRAAADRRGIDLMCSGTHPFSRWAHQPVSPDPRYESLLGEMQWMARRLLIFGVHVHVGVGSAEHAVAITNALTAHIPHFLALTGSSPYWEGVDTGLASSRSKVFEGLPTAGLPAQIEDWTDFERFMETLVESGSIRTIREVWWDIRPHPEFGTVELRMCDGIPTLTEVTAVAALAQCLVASMADRLDAGEPLERPRDWLLRQNKWRAGRHGIDAEFILDEHGAVQPARDAIAGLVDQVAPTASRLGCSDELALVHRILAAGPSYERQRRVAAAGGPGEPGEPGVLQDVVRHLVRELATDELGA
jgi:carboxylate-amine ligase